MQDILNNAKELACKLESYDSLTDDLLASASKIIKSSENNQEVSCHFAEFYFPLSSVAVQVIIKQIDRFG